MDDNVNFIKQKEQYISVFNEVIELMKDMALAVPTNYSIKKLYPFRDLCLAYLLICKNNVEAALHLFKNDLGDQINYINRNMFEMVVTLFYINDNNKKDERATRYFEYNKAVVNYRTRENVLKYPDELSNKFTKETNQKIDQAYKEFVDKYCKKKGNIKSWSGMSMPEMIESLSNQSNKENLLKQYKLGTILNNNFLHPTITHIRSVFSAFYEHKTNHELIMLQAMTVMHLTGYIIDIFLSQFQKGRPAFQARIDAAGNKFIEIETFYSKELKQPVDKME